MASDTKTYAHDEPIVYSAQHAVQNTHTILIT